MHYSHIYAPCHSHSMLSFSFSYFYFQLLGVNVAHDDGTVCNQQREKMPAERATLHICLPKVNICTYICECQVGRKSFSISLSQEFSLFIAAAVAALHATCNTKKQKQLQAAGIRQHRLQPCYWLLLFVNDLIQIRLDWQTLESRPQIICQSLSEVVACNSSRLPVNNVLQLNSMLDYRLSRLHFWARTEMNECWRMPLVFPSPKLHFTCMATKLITNCKCQAILLWSPLLSRGELKKLACHPKHTRT